MPNSPNAYSFAYDVFISYSHKDEAWVHHELLPRLEAHGLQVCIDFRDFRVGVPSIVEMERAILTSRHTVLVLTPNYLQSAWTSFERVMLQTLDPASRARRLIPLLKEPCEMPLWMRYLTAIDFTDPHNQEFAWTRLMATVAGPIGRFHDLNSKSEDLAKQNTIFISYSHNDRRWLKRLQVHLKPLERLGVIERWDDTMINPGTKWRDEIRKAIEAAKVAILLVSADFLASDFISTDELPPLLAKAASMGTVVLPVIVSPCRFEHTKGLSQFQAVNPPSRPLIMMTKGHQECVLVQVSEIIENALHKV